MSGSPPTMRYHVPPGTWNAQRIVAALRDWTLLVKAPPRVLDWCAVGRAQAAYGAELWARHYPRWPEASTVKRIFGSWREALIAAGLPVDRPALELGVQERISAARRMRSNGVSQAQIAGELGVHPSAVANYLRARLCDCGERYVVVGRRCTACAARRGPIRPWTPERVVAAILSWRELEGRPPTSEQWQAGPRAAGGRWLGEYPAWPRVKDVQRHFGSWNAALVAAGIQPVHPIGVPKQEVVSAVCDAHAQLGDRLSYKTYTAWARARQRPSTTLLVRHFGSFNAALEQAGIAPRHQAAVRASSQPN